MVVMKKNTYTIIYKHEEVDNTFIIRLKPDNDQCLSFKAGQYCEITNPKFRPDEEHSFSIASSPLQRGYLEFCIKVYGQWTERLSKCAVGDKLEISGPYGSFGWDPKTTYAVFLVGGVGISPVISILRTLENSKEHSDILFLYGNRTPETVMYSEELESLQTKSGSLRIVNIYSHLSEDHPWNGYRGFITPDILQNEVDFSKNPFFYIVGPPIFIEKMNALLHEKKVPQNSIYQELL